jgi:AraC family transcriptional regulator, arabinose operon regulatory protein
MVAGAGLFPTAAGHLCRRPRGSDQVIGIFCVRGIGWAELGDRSFQVNTGDLLVLPAGVPHAYGADKQRPWTIYWFHSTGTHWPNFVHELGVTPENPIVRIGEDVAATALFEEIIENLERNHTPLNILESSLVLGHLLGRLVRRRHQHWEGHLDTTRKVALSIAFVEEHLDRAPTVKALAGIANLSPSHFMTLFKRQTGYPPHEYIKWLRMHWGRELLNNSNLSIKEIAAVTGFKDSSHFSRTFKAVYKVSPKAYRIKAPRR